MSTPSGGVPDQAIPLASGDEAFAHHVYDAFGVSLQIFEKRLGGSVIVAEKRPIDGPITVLTSGLSRLPVDQGLPIELAVEVVEGQQGAAMIALQVVCNDIATKRRTPPVGKPWRNTTPFLNRTEITALVATESRWGASFDEVRSTDGTLVGHVRTLRLLTDAEAAVVADQDWDSLVKQVGSVDALLDVTRESTVTVSSAQPATGRPAAPAAVVVMSKFHEQYPPRWLTLSNGIFQSVTGAESPEYMAERDNHEIISLDVYLARFPWTEPFARSAQEGQSAKFSDASGAFTLED